MVEGVELGHSEMASVIVGSWRVSAARFKLFVCCKTSEQRGSFIVEAKSQALMLCLVTAHRNMLS